MSAIVLLRNIIFDNILINFHIFHIFSLPNLFKMLYSNDNILYVYDKIVDIKFYTYKPYSFSQISLWTWVPPQTVTDALNNENYRLRKILDL